MIIVMSVKLFYPKFINPRMKARMVSVRYSPLLKGTSIVNMDIDPECTTIGSILTSPVAR